MPDASVDALPRWSGQALSNRDIFFRNGFNVHFFVEDEDKESLYEVIFSRLFPRLKNFKIFPLNGKSSVLAHARSANDDQIKRVYVLDKDFDDLHEKMVNLPNLFYLDDYCIESALYDESSIINFAVDEAPSVRKATIQTKVSYSENLAAWLPELDQLHRLFFLSQKYGVPMKNCGLSVYVFCEDGNHWKLSPAKIRAYSDELYHSLKDMNVVDTRRAFDELVRKAFGGARLQRKHISGRFVIGLFVAHLRQKKLLTGNVRLDSLNIRLARTSGLSRLHGLKSRIRTWAF